LPDDEAVCLVMKRISMLQAVLISKTCVTGALSTQGRSIKGPFIVIRLVWCAISRIGIIGPYFFYEDDRTVIVNSERYVAMIQEFYAPALEELNARLV